MDLVCVSYLSFTPPHSCAIFFIIFVSTCFWDEGGCLCGFFAVEEERWSEDENVQIFSVILKGLAGCGTAELC